MTKAKKPDGPSTPATAALAAAGISCSLHPYDLDEQARSYGESAAHALGVTPDRVFKTLVAEVDDKLSVAVVPVAGSLDLKALAAALGGRRAVMAEPSRVERVTGYVVGGISPLGQRRALRTVIDESALGFATIFFSAGRRGLQVEVAPVHLVALTRARTAAITRR